jgi:hypothetical protein
MLSPEQFKEIANEAYNTWLFRGSMTQRIREWAKDNKIEILSSAEIDDILSAVFERIEKEAI